MSTRDELVAAIAERYTADLRRMLAAGLDLKRTGNGWAPIPSETGAPALPHMGFVAWNYTIPETPIENKLLNRAGIFIVVRDASETDARGLQEAIKSGLVEPEPADGSEDV